MSSFSLIIIGKFCLNFQNLKSILTFFCPLGLLISWTEKSSCQIVFPIDDYKAVTESASGCHCWFDPLEQLVDAKSCACCTDDGVQCGYPQQKWCQPKVADGEIQLGCLGNYPHSYINIHVSI